MAFPSMSIDASCFTWKYTSPNLFLCIGAVWFFVPMYKYINAQRFGTGRNIVYQRLYLTKGTLRGGGIGGAGSKLALDTCKVERQLGWCRSLYRIQILGAFRTDPAPLKWLVWACLQNTKPKITLAKLFPL